MTSSAGPTAALAPAAPGQNIDAIAAAVAARLTQQLDAAADQRFQAYAEKVIRFTDQFALRMAANLQDIANRTEEEMVASTQQRLGDLIDRIQAGRTIVENRLGRFDALEEYAAAVVKDAGQKIREASDLAVKSAQQEVATSLRKGVERTSATLESACQARALDAITRTVNGTLARADEQLAVQTKDRLSRAYAELKWHQEHMIDEINEQADQIVLAEKSGLSAKVETLAKEIVPVLRTQMEKSLRQSAGKVLAQTTRSLQEQAQLLSQDTLISLQQAVQNVEGRIQEDDQRQRVARSGLALEDFQSGLQTLSREMQAGAAESLARKLQGMADEMAETSAERARQRIQDEAVAAAEIFREESNRRLSAMAQEFFASTAQEFQERLRSHAEAQLDAVIQSAPDKFEERINRVTHEAGLTLVKVTGRELQKLAENLFEWSSEALRKKVERLADNLQNDLKAFQSTLSDDAQKQLLAISRSTVQALNQEALAGLEKFRARLQTSAQESHEESLRELETNFQETLAKLRAAVFAMLQQPNSSLRNEPSWNRRI